MDLNKKINKIKELRMKPEERFIVNIINSVIPYNHQKDNYLLKYKNGDKLMFSYDIRYNTLWIDYLIYKGVSQYSNDENYLYDIIKRYFKNYLHNNVINKVNYGSLRIKKDKYGFNQYL